MDCLTLNFGKFLEFKPMPQYYFVSLLPHPWMNPSRACFAIDYFREIIVLFPPKFVSTSF